MPEMLEIDAGTALPIRRFGEIGGFWLAYNGALWGGFCFQAQAEKYAISQGWQVFCVGFGSVNYINFKPQSISVNWLEATIAPKEH
jgi:hypothetical protein